MTDNPNPLITRITVICANISIYRSSKYIPLSVIRKPHTRTCLNSYPTLRKMALIKHNNTHWHNYTSITREAKIYRILQNWNELPLILLDSSDLMMAQTNWSVACDLMASKCLEDQFLVILWPCAASCKRKLLVVNLKITCTTVFTRYPKLASSNHAMKGPFLDVQLEQNKRTPVINSGCSGKKTPCVLWAPKQNNGFHISICFAGRAKVLQQHYPSHAFNDHLVVVLKVKRRATYQTVPHRRTRALESRECVCFLATLQLFWLISSIMKTTALSPYYDQWSDLRHCRTRHLSLAITTNFK